MIDLNPTTGRRTVFVHEHVSGGGMAGTELPDSWLAEGRAMLEAAVTAFADAGCEVVTTIDPRVDFDLPVETIRVESPQRAEAILSEMTLRTDFGLVIAPETGGILHRLTTLAERTPGWHLGSSTAAVALCGDKLATARHLQRHGFPHPRTSKRDTFAEPTGCRARFVVKPVDGAGTVETFLIDADRLPHWLKCIGPDRDQVLIQDYQPGDSAGLSFLCDGQGEILPVAACLHAVIQEPVEQGIHRFILTSGQPFDSLSGGAIELASAAVRTIPGLRGWVGVDLIVDPVDGIDTILEINPRLTSSFDWCMNRTNRSEIAARWLAMACTKRLR